MIESSEKHELNQTNVELPTSRSYHFLGSRTERIFFLILITILSAGPIIFGKSIPSHADWHIHIEHAYNFKRCFWQGQFLPRWIDAQVNGYGEPIFNYYAPLTYYLFTFLEIFFRNPVLSIKWTFVIPMILCTIFGYTYLRRHGSPLASTITMAFIVFSPAIHIFIYNTNWPTSTLGLAFLFLTLYGIDRFDKNADFDLKSFLITSVGFSGMALAHLATAFMFTLISVPYFFFSLFIYRTRKFVKTFFLSLALGAAMAGFYLFPACLEKNLVHTDEILTQAPLWDYSKNFLFTYLDRHRDDGYAWGIFDHRYYEISNALFSLVVLVCIIILLLNMERVKTYFKEPFRVTIAISLFTACFLMMTPISIFMWLMLKPMQTIQFPWRYTAFALPFGALTILYTFDLVGKLIKEKVDVIGYKIIFYFIAGTFAALLYVDAINMYRWSWVPEQSLIKAGLNVLWGNEEYRPNLTGDPNWKQTNYKQDFSPSIESSSQSSDINLVRWVSHERIFEVFAPEEQQIKLRTFYFPGWSVYIDNQKTELNMDPKTGSIIFKVPAGRHQIKAKFELTPLRKASAYISLGAFALFVYLLLKLLQGKKFVIENIAKKREEKIPEVQIS